jgi:two-component system, OmpR family, sensor histidine kinase CiaH
MVRLAAQTVALLLVMLVVLEVVVYVITQQSLLNSLQGTLKARATFTPQFVTSLYHLPVPGQGSQQGSYGPGGGYGEPSGGNPGGANHNFGPGGPGGPGGGPPPLDPDQIPSDVDSVFVDTRLHFVHHIGTLGNIILDRPNLKAALRAGQPQGYSLARYQNQDYLVYSKPIRSGGHIVGAVQNAVSENQYESSMHLLFQALIVVALLGLVTSSIVSAVVVRRSLQPIQTAVRRQRDFVADAAHELRTPLAIMRTVGELGLDAESIDDLQATVAQMLGQNHHLTKLVEDLSLLARSDTDAVTLDHDLVDLSRVVRDTAAELSVLTADHDVTLRADIADGISVTGDVLRLRQLLLILLDNALKHTPSGGTIDVDLALSGGRVRLRVIDSGEGIPSAELPRIFDRFYRADAARAGEGTGLGLAIGKWIVEAHGGTVRAANVAPHGAALTVTLPPARRGAEPATEPAALPGDA